MIEHLDADKLLQGPLGEWLEANKGEREATAKKSNRRFLILFAVVIPVFLWNVQDGFFEASFFLLFLTMFGTFIGVGWAYWPRHVATQAVKIGINQAIAEAVGISYRDRDQLGAAYDRLKAHGLLPSHNRERFEDFWEGDVAGHHFRLHEAVLEQHTTNSEGKSSTVRKFQGPFLQIGFGESFRGTTILQRAGSNKRFGFFGGKKDEITAAGKTLAAVDMVHPEFEDAFDVYSTDQVEARYLVHPRYIERLIAIEQAFKGKQLRALFLDGDLTVMLSADNMFESGTLDARKDREKLEKTIEQFRSLANLAIELNRR